MTPHIERSAIEAVKQWLTNECAHVADGKPYAASTELRLVLYQSSTGKLRLTVIADSKREFENDR